MTYTISPFLSGIQILERFQSIVILQPFIGVVGPFLASLFSGFALRSLLAAAARRITAALGAEVPNGPVPGLGLGDYELHVIKAAHLGLCQVS